MSTVKNEFKKLAEEIFEKACVSVGSLEELSAEGYARVLHPQEDDRQAFNQLSILVRDCPSCLCCILALYSFLCIVLSCHFSATHFLLLSLSVPVSHFRFREGEIIVSKMSAIVIAEVSLCVRIFLTPQKSTSLSCLPAESAGNYGGNHPQLSASRILQNHVQRQGQETQIL